MSKKQIGVLWDLDGTLIDTGPYHFQAWQKTLSEYRIDFYEADFKATFGMNNNSILKKMFGGELSQEKIEKISNEKEGQFRSIIHGFAKPFPGVRHCLEDFREAGFKQAIASSAPMDNIDFLLSELNLKSYFDEIISAADLPGKPDPTVFLKAANALELSPKDCVVIEDAVAGVEAAKRSGAKCIAVTTTSASEDLADADWIISDFFELTSEKMFEMV
jgi:beta-phosphoglucomutase family hydrolase